MRLERGIAAFLPPLKEWVSSGDFYDRLAAAFRQDLLEYLRDIPGSQSAGMEQYRRYLIGVIGTQDLREHWQKLQAIPDSAEFWRRLAAGDAGYVTWFGTAPRYPRRAQ